MHAETQVVMQTLIYRNLELDNRNQELKERNEEPEDLWEVEISTCIRVENILDRTESELRVKHKRMDRMQYTYRISYWWLQDRMERFPLEIGQTSHTLSRTLASHLIVEEYNEVITRSL